MHEGDVSYSKVKAGILVIKILRVATDQGAYHCLVYKSLNAPPQLADVPNLDVLAWHSPIDATHIDKENIFLGNIPVSSNELVGYLEYLKRMDFERYIEETHQDLKTVLAKSNEHYKHGCALNGEEAIAEYTKALDIYPRHYYALDNRGFRYMELGDLQTAMKDFQESAGIHATNFTALFGLGECNFKLGNYQLALEYFEKAKEFEPQNKTVLGGVARAKAKILGTNF